MAARAAVGISKGAVSKIYFTNAFIELVEEAAGHSRRYAQKDCGRIPYARSLMPIQYWLRYAVSDLSQKKFFWKTQINASFHSLSEDLWLLSFITRRKFAHSVWWVP